MARMSLPLSRWQCLMIAYDRHGESLDALTWTPRSKDSGDAAANRLVEYMNRPDGFLAWRAAREQGRDGEA